MAEASISWVQDQFSCSICLDLLKDPVTINCGHSFCKSCIKDCWNQEDQKRVYSCPQCRQTFTPRPALGKNVILAEMVETLKKTKRHSDGPAPSYAGPEDVECDVCTGRKRKAIKSCLVCLESYCQSHFEKHEGFHSGRRHNVIEATGRLQEMICSQHDKQLEIYCRTDHQCVCYLCMMDEHRNHDTVAAVVERREKQTALEETQRHFQQRIQETQKKLQELRESVKSHKRSAQTAVDDTERIFTELIRSIERRRSEVIQLIRDQEKTAVSRAEGLLKEVEQEIDHMKRKDTELQHLSETDDDIYFLQSFQALSAPPGSTDNITVSSPLSFDDVRNSVSQLKEIVEEICKKEMERISGKVSYSENIANGHKSRAELLQYSRQFSLDPNTAHKNICLSEGNRAATCTGTVQQYPDHPGRFDNYYQVLCRESVCGRCYWEVELNGIDSVSISVSYKKISRKGNTDESKFGYSDKSWRFVSTPSSYSVWHNKIQTNVPVVSSSSRIGVYVDHSAGFLSFYSVSDTVTLIHRVHTTFTQPLYPGFWLNLGTSLKLY